MNAVQSSADSAVTYAITFNPQHFEPKFVEVSQYLNHLGTLLSRRDDGSEYFSPFPLHKSGTSG